MAGTTRPLAAYKEATMSTEPFTDDILSTIIDGEADPELVASVANDPVATARLERMQAAVELVATPPPDATPQRRAASIAAALAAATPQPDVTSLATARHARSQAPSRKLNPQWLALAAAMILLVVAIPLLGRAIGTESADVASSATDSSNSLGSGDTSDDSTDDSAEDATDTADDVMEEADVSDAPDESPGLPDSAFDGDVTADDAVDDTESEDTGGVGRLATAPVASNLDIVNDYIALGSLSPILTAEEAIAEGVAPECVDDLGTSDAPMFDVAILDEFGGAPRVVLISFAEDGTSMVFDAEDCALLG